VSRCTSSPAHRSMIRSIALLLVRRCAGQEAKHQACEVRARSSDPGFLRPPRHSYGRALSTKRTRRLRPTPADFIPPGWDRPEPILSYARLTSDWPAMAVTVRERWLAARSSPLCAPPWRREPWPTRSKLPATLLPRDVNAIPHIVLAVGASAEAPRWVEPPIAGAREGGSRGKADRREGSFRARS
jgi:hypothetical protein